LSVSRGRRTRRDEEDALHHTDFQTVQDSGLTFFQTVRFISRITKGKRVAQTVAILGASRDRGKYGNQSVRAHRRAGFEVFPINLHAEEIEGIPAFRSLRDLPVGTLDRISVYLPAEVGLTLLDDIAACQPREVWFNPGSESDELLTAAERLGLNVICACSIVDAASSSRMTSR
jgi:predicted CoA-binding protein